MSYDPVEPHALAPETLQASLDDALQAIAKASDLDEFKAARLAHAGDRSPLALANREIGALPPAGEGGSRPAGRPGARRRSRRRSRPGRPSSRPSATPACWSRRRSTSRCRGTATAKAPATR